MPVERQDGSLDDWHGACMHDLHNEHDLAIRQQLFGRGKLGNSIFSVDSSV